MMDFPSVPLGEVANIVRGVTFSKTEAVDRPAEGLLPVLRAGNIQDRLVLDDGLIYVPREKVNKKQILRQGDIVICTSSGSSEIVGKTAFAKSDWEGSFGAFCAGIRAKPDKCDPSFLFHYLRSPAFRSWAQKSSGANIKNIRKSELDLFEVPLPPLPDQRRIAAILDKAGGIRRKREHALEMADRFLRSAFEQMFGDLQNNPKQWDTVLLGDILSSDPQNGLYRPAKDYGSGTCILRIDGFYDGYLVKDKPLKRLRLDRKTIDKYLLYNGDIVINRVNSREYLGKSTLVECVKQETVFESNMMRFRVLERLSNPRFLVDQLQTRFIKRQIIRASKDAVNQSSINQTDVKSLEVRLPPIDLQRKYADLVAKKTASDGVLHEAVASANELFDSLAQRAFRGDL